MRRILSLLLAAFIALMPLVGMACDAAPAAEEVPCHSQDVPADKDPGASCADMKGCCAAVLVSAGVAGSSTLALEERAVPVASLTPGFVPDPQHRPPVL